MASSWLAAVASSVSDRWPSSESSAAEIWASAVDAESSEGSAYLRKCGGYAMELATLPSPTVNVGQRINAT